jgi:hypothetical protein
VFHTIVTLPNESPRYTRIALQVLALAVVFRKA